jgi:hypothetical protein
MADPVEALADLDEQDEEARKAKAFALIDGDDLIAMPIAKYIEAYPDCGYDVVSLIFIAN